MITSIGTYFDIVSFVVVAAFTEQTMGYDTVLVKHVKDGISVLSHVSLSTKFNM